MGNNSHRYVEGEKHNMLTLISLYEKKNGANLWNVRCDCGNIIVTRPATIRRGDAKSCGCYATLNPSHKTHGMSKSSIEYDTWCSLRGRCLNQKNKQYPNYGGRGIKVCKEWDSFEQFYRDMGKRPIGTSIDRIDVNGDYEPSNCRWASAMEQGANRRFCKSVILDGREVKRVEAEKALDIGYGSINNRKNKSGETLQEATDYFAKKKNFKWIREFKIFTREAYGQAIITTLGLVA